MGGKVFFEMANLTIRPSLAAMPDLLLKNHSSTTIQRACERREGANEQAPSLPQRKVGESERGRERAIARASERGGHRCTPLPPTVPLSSSGKEGIGSSERASGSSESASKRGGEEKRTSEEGRKEERSLHSPAAGATAGRAEMLNTDTTPWGNASRWERERSLSRSLENVSRKRRMNCLHCSHLPTVP